MACSAQGRGGSTRGNAARVVVAQPDYACALRLEEHIAGPEHRFWPAVDLEEDGAIDDAPDHWAVVHMQASSVARDYPDPPDFDAVGVLELRQVHVEQHFAGNGLRGVRNGARGHFPSSTGTRMTLT